MTLRGRTLPYAGVPQGEEPRGGRRKDEVLALRLIRYRRIGTAVGGLVLLLASVTAIGGIFQSPRPFLFVMFGLVFGNVGIAFLRFFHNTGNRQRWIRKFAVPHPMRLLLREEGAAATALLFAREGEADMAQPLYRTAVSAKAGKYDESSEVVDCQVYFDPEHGLPAVIETEDAVFWARG